MPLRVTVLNVNEDWEDDEQVQTLSFWFLAEPKLPLKDFCSMLALGLNVCPPHVLTMFGKDGDLISSQVVFKKLKDAVDTQNYEDLDAMGLLSSTTKGTEAVFCLKSRPAPEAVSMATPKTRLNRRQQL